MNLTLAPAALSALVLATAIGYAIATFGLKLASDALSPMALALILAGFLLATVTEIVLLQRADLSVVYIAILAVETLLMVMLAFSLGDDLSIRHWVGSAMAIGGVMLAIT